MNLGKNLERSVMNFGKNLARHKLTFLADFNNIDLHEHVKTSHEFWQESCKINLNICHES